MKKAYDILLNFKNIPYDFYEWEKSDNIINIKAIPIFAVSTETLYDFVYSNLIVDNKFIKKIENETETFSDNNSFINYSCILYDNNIAYAFLFDSDGSLLSKSKLLFEESDEITDSYNEKDITKIEYNIIKKDYNKQTYRTRKEEKILYIVTNYIKKLYEEEKYDELRYLYLECFNTEPDNDENTFLKIINNVYNDEILDKILFFIKILKK